MRVDVRGWGGQGFVPMLLWPSLAHPTAGTHRGLTLHPLLAITTDLNFKNTTATSGFIPAVEGSELDTLLDLLQPNPQTY